MSETPRNKIIKESFVEDIQSVHVSDIGVFILVRFYFRAHHKLSTLLAPTLAIVGHYDGPVDRILQT